MTTKQSKICLTLAALLALSSVVTPVQGYNLARHPRETPQCRPCDTRQIPQETLTHRLQYSCMTCGIMYGTAIEHCCVCYESFTAQCRQAIEKK